MGRRDTAVWLADNGVQHDLLKHDDPKVYHKRWYEHGNKKLAAGGKLQYWVRKRQDAAEHPPPTLDLTGVASDLPYKYMGWDHDLYNLYQDHLPSGPYWRWTHHRPGEESRGQ
eukprot:281175-Rhodomonas_salina.2